ncbi:MAG: cysteine desulfurase, SufS subfamily [Thermoleophilia bacterium]|nr:cysteine desulfurase, SufS subfamily [Thermoleophilia bacterium]
MIESPAPAAPGAVPALDPERISADFPILAAGPNTGRRLAFLDSAASAMKPRAVIDSLRATYEGAYANVHRGVYAHAATATANFEAVREQVRALLNARTPREVIFTRGTTEAINLVAYSWGRTNLGPGDIVLTTELEHHSNLVPWQQACAATGGELRFIPVDDDGVLDVSDLDSLVAGGTLRMVAVVHASNSLGTITPLDLVVPWAKAQGSLVLVDGAQSVPHTSVDVQALGIDFLAFSGHKLMGPTGAGALWGREELLAEMPPWQFGGEMIRRVEYAGATFNDLPWKFEAGTPAIAEVIGMGAAIEYLTGLGLDAVHAHEVQLVRYGHERLLEVPGLRVLGPALGEPRGGVLSFTLEGTHPHDIATLLDTQDVNVRAGHHCTQPLMKRLGIHATARASVYAYNTREDVDRLIDGLGEVRRVFGLT